MKFIFIITLIISLFKFEYSESQDLDTQEIKRKNNLLEKSIFSFIDTVGFPINRTVNNSNLLTLNSNCHHEKQQI